jgi:membrane protease YdiL (CAAX protease family)
LKKLTDWVMNHQIIVFFILTFLITWGLGFSYGAVMKHGKIFLAPLVFVATCGPGLAGIIITAVSGRRPKMGHRSTPWVGFFTAWIMAAIVFLAHYAFVNRAPLSPTWLGLAIVSVVPVAFIISRAYSRSPAVRSYLAPLIRTKGVFPGIILALTLIPGLSLISVAISRLLGRPSVSFSGLPATGITLIGWIALKFLYQFFFFNGTGEEVGWRGFALPRLQGRVSPLIASLAISLFWVPWHVFLWQAEGQPIQAWSYWIMSYLIHIPAGVIICWLYNRSQGSILVAGIAHAAANTALALLRNLDLTVLTLTIFAFVMVIVLVDRMWQKLPLDHPAVAKSHGMLFEETH